MYKSGKELSFLPGSSNKILFLQRKISETKKIIIRNSPHPPSPLKAFCDCLMFEMTIRIIFTNSKPPPVDDCEISCEMKLNHRSLEQKKIFTSALSSATLSCKSRTRSDSSIFERNSPSATISEF